MVAENWIGGMTLVLAAGALLGTYMLLTKYTPKWNWENMWLSYSTMAFLIFPWGVAFIAVPHLKEIIGETSDATLLRTILFGFGWGLGSLTWGLGIDCLGLALGVAIILGLTSSIGTLIPLLLHPSATMAATQKLLIIIGVAVMVVAICVCAWAGKQKERALNTGQEASNASSRKSFALGLVLCIMSGVLSACANLGFAYGSEMAAVAMKFNTPHRYASFPFWAVITLPLFVCNAAFCLYLLGRKQSFAKFLLPRTGGYHSLTAMMAVMWLGGMLIYGMGANMLGRMGPSIGWPVKTSSVIIIANLCGLVTGEWRGTGRRPMRTMSAALLLLVVAIFIVGVSNR